MLAGIALSAFPRDFQVSTAFALRATWRKLLDIAFPWECLACHGFAPSVLCRACLDRVRWIAGSLCTSCGLPLASSLPCVCGRCALRPPAFSRARAVACYRASDEESDPLGACIRALKYGGRRSLAAPLAEILADRFPFDPTEFDLLIPVPLHLERLRFRGFNQARLLARGPAHRFRLSLVDQALERSKSTLSQVGLSEPERRRNLRGAFVVRRPADIRGQRILLVDDVTTTTATVDACALALRTAGARSVDVLALARTLLH